METQSQLTLLDLIEAVAEVTDSEAEQVPDRTPQFHGAAFLSFHWRTYSSTIGTSAGAQSSDPIVGAAQAWAAARSPSATASRACQAASSGMSRLVRLRRATCSA